MNLSPASDPTEFNRFLFEEIELEEYRFKFLKDYIQKASSGQITIYDSSLLNISDTGWILIIHSDMLLIYGENWSIEQIREINAVFDLNNFNNFKLSGDENLIDQIIEFNQPTNFEIIKRRIFYQSKDINIFGNKNTKIRIASLQDLEVLAIMLQQYYHEEYCGQNDKTLEEMEERVNMLILSEKIFVILNDDEDIASFCTIINPDIGILFTKVNYRNNGYGKVLLSHCSKQLLNKKGIVYLMTNRNSLDSNIVCERVGFTSYFYYKIIEINRT